MLLCTGVICGVKTKFIMFRQFGNALRLPFAAGRNSSRSAQNRHKRDTLSSFGAAMTALAGTLGTGNIIGVAAAIRIGGPGALFWMSVAAVCGMAVKYVEIYFACKSRRLSPARGGNMFLLQDVLHAPVLAKCFAISCIVTGFGVGNLAQTSAAGAIFSALPLAPSVRHAIVSAAAVLFAATLYVGMRGGGKRVGRMTSVLTPVVAIGYLLCCAVILVQHAERIIPVLGSVLRGGFGWNEVSGGFSGAGLALAVKTGVTRGLFTNESGLGSAPIAHAATAEQPHQAGLWGVFEVFFDTVVMCSVTGLTLLVSGVDPALSDMTVQVFQAEFGTGGILFLCAALWLFGLAAALGWGFYGSQSLRFLYGERQNGQKLYVLLFSAIACMGFYAPLSSVLFGSDIANSVMLLLGTGTILLLLDTDRVWNSDSSKKKRILVKLREIKR